MEETETVLPQLFAEEEAAVEAEEAPAAEPEAPSAPEPGMVQAHWAGVERLYSALLRQAEDVKAVHPEFDLAREAGNPEFIRMLRSGAGMRNVYRALHSDELVRSAMQFAARAAEQRMASAMRSGLYRPAENGLSGGGAIRTGYSVKDLPNQEFARLCGEIAKGAKYSFG